MGLHDMKREWVRAIRNPIALIVPSLFYTIILIMFIFIDTPDTARFAELLPRMVLVPAFLAMLMIPSQLYHDDYLSGYLQYYLMNSSIVLKLISIRLIIIGLIYLLPLLVITITFSAMMGIALPVVQAMMIALSVALPTLFVMAAFAGALTLALPQASLLQAVILMPLYIPVLLFSQSLIQRAQMGLGYMAFVYLLLGLLLLSMVCLPIITVNTLKWAYE